MVRIGVRQNFTVSTVLKSCFFSNVGLVTSCEGRRCPFLMLEHTLSPPLRAERDVRRWSTYQELMKYVLSLDTFRKVITFYPVSFFGRVVQEERFHSISLLFFHLLIKVLPFRLRSVPIPLHLKISVFPAM